MIRFLFALLITVNMLNATAQVEPDKIIFGEFLVGASHNDGLAFGVNLNYQSGLHLFTARYLTHRNFYNKLIAGYAFNGNLNVRSQQDEWALLYGPRVNFERFSASSLRDT